MKSKLKISLFAACILSLSLAWVINHDARAQLSTCPQGAVCHYEANPNCNAMAEGCEPIVVVDVPPPGDGSTPPTTTPPPPTGGTTTTGGQCSTGTGGAGDPQLCNSKFTNKDAPQGCQDGTSFCVKVEGCETKVEALKIYLSMIGRVAYGSTGKLTTNDSCPPIPGMTIGDGSDGVDVPWGAPVASIMRCGIGTVEMADCFKSIFVSYLAAISNQCKKVDISRPECQGTNVTTTPDCISPGCKDMLLYLAEKAGEQYSPGDWKYDAMRAQLYGDGKQPCIMPFNPDGSLSGCSFDPNNFPPITGDAYATSSNISSYIFDKYIFDKSKLEENCFTPSGDFSDVALSGSEVGMGNDGSSSCYQDHYAMFLGRDACGNSFLAESTVASGFSCYSTNQLGTTTNGGPGVNWMGCPSFGHYNSSGNCFAATNTGGNGAPFSGGCMNGCVPGEPLVTWYYEVPKPPPTEKGMCSVGASDGSCCPVPDPYGSSHVVDPTAPTNAGELSGYATGTSGGSSLVETCKSPIANTPIQPLRGDVNGAKGLPDSHMRLKTDVVNPYAVFFHKDFYHTSNYTSACYYFNNLMSRVTKGTGWFNLPSQTNYKCMYSMGYDPATGTCQGGEPLSYNDYEQRLENINWVNRFFLEKAGDDQSAREAIFKMYEKQKADLESQTQVLILSQEIPEYLKRLDEQSAEYGNETEKVLEKFLPFLKLCPGISARECFEKFMSNSGCDAVADIKKDYVDDLMNLGCNDDDIAIRMGGKLNELPIPRVKGKLLPGVSHEETRRLTIACADHMIRSFRSGPPARPGTVLQALDPLNICNQKEGQDKADCYASQLCQPLKIKSKALYEKSMGFKAGEHWPAGYCRVTKAEISGDTDPTNANPPMEYFSQRIQVANGIYPQRIMEPEPSALSADSYYYDADKQYPKRNVQKMNEGWRDYKEYLTVTQDLSSIKEMNGTLCFPRPVAVLAKGDELNITPDLVGRTSEPNSTEMPETRQSRDRTKTNLWPRTDHSDAFSPRHQEDKFEYQSKNNDPLDMYPVCFVCAGNFQYDRNMMTPMQWEIKNYAKCIDCIRWCKNYLEFNESKVVVTLDGGVNCTAAWVKGKEVIIGKAKKYGDCCTSGGDGYCGESFVGQGQYTYNDPMCYTYEYNGGNSIDPINLPHSWFCHKAQYSGEVVFKANTTEKKCVSWTYSTQLCSTEPAILCGLQCTKWEDVYLTEDVVVPWTCTCPTQVSDNIECSKCNPTSVEKCCEQNISPRVYPENLLNLGAIENSWGNGDYNKARISTDKSTTMERLPYGGPDYKAKAYQYPVPEGFSFHEEFGKNHHCMEYNKRYRSDWCAIKSDLNVPESITGTPIASERRMPWLQWYQLNDISCKGYEDSIVGVGDDRQNCAYGGWEELKLYQLRCYRIWGVDCICDYEKTFKVGSAEEYVLKAAGGDVEFDYSHMTNVNVIQKATHTPTVEWPINWAGYVSEPDIEYRFPAVGLKEYYGYPTNRDGLISLVGQGILQTNLDNAQSGDIIIWDRDVLWSTKPLNTPDLTVTEFDVLGKVMGNWRNSRSLIDSQFNHDGDMAGDSCGGEGENDRRISEQDHLADKPDSKLGYNVYMPIENSRLPHVAYVLNAHTVKALTKKIEDFGKKCGTEFGKKGMMKAECDESVSDLKSMKDELAELQANKDRQFVEIAEANFGKNPDICGNTDKWGMRTTRRLYPAVKGFAMTAADLADTKGSCSDPENRNCHEALWDRVKVWHIGKDLRHSPKQAP